MRPVDIDSDSEDEAEILQYKIILLGDGAVGKTSIAMRYSEDYFAKQYKQTIGLDFFTKTLTLPGDISVSLQIWDIGGQTIGGNMISNYIYGAQAAILCYDITNFQSFQNLSDWLKLIKRTFGREEMPYLALVGNKTDTSHLRTVKLDRHSHFARDNEMASFFMSAKTGDNVNAAFYRLAADLANVPLSRPDLDVQAKVVKAEIVQHDNPTKEESSKRKEGSRKGSSRSSKSKKSGKMCSIM